MKIPSLQKIEKQVESYLKKNKPILSEKANWLEREMIRINKKYNHIQEFCEKNRGKNSSHCICQGHEDYQKFLNELKPVKEEYDSLIGEWRVKYTKMQNDYKSFLMSARNGKRNYVIKT